MATESNKVKLLKKLLEIQKRVKGVGKDSKSFGYSYTSGSKIIAEIKPMMNDLGLLLKQEVISIDNQRQDYSTKNGQKSEILTTTIQRFTWVDVDTGETDENLFAANGQNDFEKGLGSALTYAERYFLLKYFHISTDEDDIDNPERKTTAPVKATSTPKTTTKEEVKPPTSAGKPLSGMQPNTSFDSTPEPTSDVTERKAKATKAFETLDKAKVLGYIIGKLKKKYTSIATFIEKESIDVVLSTYEAVKQFKKEPVKATTEEK